MSTPDAPSAPETPGLDPYAYNGFTGDQMRALAAHTASPTFAPGLRTHDGVTGKAGEPFGWDTKTRALADHVRGLLAPRSPRRLPPVAERPDSDGTVLATQVALTRHGTRAYAHWQTFAAAPLTPPSLDPATLHRYALTHAAYTLADALDDLIDGIRSRPGPLYLAEREHAAITHALDVLDRLSETPPVGEPPEDAAAREVRDLDHVANACAVVADALACLAYDVARHGAPPLRGR